jgi:hypothetical protein
VSRSTRTKKATFNLSVDLLELLGEAVAQGAAPSKNALVEQAIVKELRLARQRMLRQRWEEAASDPLFRGDVAEVNAAFSAADAETAREIV